MPNLKPARGRPKGTGLDDRELLLSIRQLLASHPDMKPTTAIKALGIVDPSAIRRLRDKLRGAGHEPAEDAFSPKAAQAPASARGTVRAVALKAAGEPKRHSEIPARAGHTALAAVETSAASAAETAAKTAGPAISEAPAPQPRSGASAPRRPADWLSIWTELGITSMAVSLRAQWLLYDQVLRSQTMTAALSGPSLLQEFASAWCAAVPDKRPTVH